MNRLSLCVTILLAAALVLPATALARREPPPAPAPADTLRLTLDDAIQRSLARSEDVRTARANVRQTQGQVFQAMSQALPQISGTILYDRKLQSLFSGMAADTGGLRRDPQEQLLRRQCTAGPSPSRRNNSCGRAARSALP